MDKAKLLDRMSIAPVQPGHCEWCGILLLFGAPRLDCGHTTCEQCEGLTDRGAHCPVCVMTKAALPSAPKWRQLTRRFALYWQGVDMGVVMMLVTFTGFVALMGWMAYNTFIVPDATPVLRSAYPAAQIIDHQSQTTGFVLDDNGVLRCVGVSRSGEVWVVRSHDTNGLSPDERSRVVWSMTEGCRPGGQFR